jgi:hypothetical protein
MGGISTVGANLLTRIAIFRSFFETMEHPPSTSQGRLVLGLAEGNIFCGFVKDPRIYFTGSSVKTSNQLK